MFFDVRSPRINAFQIHEWLYETVRLTEGDVRVIQIDGPVRKMCVKFVNSERMMRVLQPIQGDLNFTMIMVKFPKREVKSQE